ncbi:E3 ubiquitin-protein ligase AIRP2 [Senna tora]|uniref:E3 ubiquitin-protein ligase AIRP2 n=1 Tax=Senna tora TaxID=362788 RepID=A0A834WZ50_9FABA|nr:E3 ubiquitin-protein ligase AIRP2 [Senna tora]
MGGAWIMSQHILDDTSRSDLRNLHELRGKRLVAQVSETRRFALYLRTGVDLMLELESSRHGRSVDHVLTYSGRQIVSSRHGDEEHDTESTQGWKTNTLKDPLQGIGGPMARARTKAMKEALNCFIRDLKELEPNYIKESTINMSSKSPRKVVTILKAQQVDVQGLCGVHMEELT